MALLEAASPAAPLYHIGRIPDPLAWADWSFVGEGRFDDPRTVRTFRVLYAAEQRLAAFVETLQKWRPAIAALAALELIPPDPGDDDVPELAAGLIPADWHLKRGIATLRLYPDQRWLDPRAHETRETLRTMLAPTLQALGYSDFDLSDALGRNRRLTRAIALFADTEGFHGIAYKSRFDSAFDCWAIFARARFDPVGRFPIASDDRDLVEAARRLNLRIP